MRSNTLTSKQHAIKRCVGGTSLCSKSKSVICSSHHAATPTLNDRILSTSEEHAIAAMQYAKHTHNVNQTNGHWALHSSGLVQCCGRLWCAVAGVHQLLWHWSDSGPLRNLCSKSLKHVSNYRIRPRGVVCLISSIAHQKQQQQHQVQNFSPSNLVRMSDSSVPPVAWSTTPLRSRRFSAFSRK